MKTAFCAICFLLMVKRSTEYSAKIVIERPSLQYISNGVVDGIRLRVNDRKNFGSGGFECDDLNAEIPSGIYSSSTLQCECKSDASTFSFFDRKWQCVDNGELRQSEGRYSNIFKVYWTLPSRTCQTCALGFLFTFYPTISAY